MMQAASDIFLGWTKGVEANRYMYWRQLRDMKGSAVVEAMVPDGMTFYARICGQTLAWAHARSGDPIALSFIKSSRVNADAPNVLSANGATPHQRERAPSGGQRSRAVAPSH
jgi:hypothetical protein